MYSNNVPEWDSSGNTTYNTGDQVGWYMQLWTAQADGLTTSEPGPDNPDWQLDTEVNLTGITFHSIPDPIDYLQTKLTGVTFTAKHTSRPPEVYLGGITFIKHRNKPYLKININ